MFDLLRESRLSESEDKPTGQSASFIKAKFRLELYKPVFQAGFYKNWLIAVLFLLCFHLISAYMHAFIHSIYFASL
jgi:hypothetical protein